MEQYVTVVSVDDHQQQQQSSSSELDQVAPEAEGVSLAASNEVVGVVPMNGTGTSPDSQFVTVLSINHGEAAEGSEPEQVLVYRLPGERLGFGLKFQGGTKNNEKIQRLFIQSCAENSPASRVQASWGYLREGDEILEIDGVSVTQMTRIECVKCLKESNLAIKLLVRNGEGKVQNFFDDNEEVPEKKSVPPPPPPVPPRKLNKRKSTAEHQSADPPAKQLVEIVHPPDAEVYSNLFCDDISDWISESDDTASTISTVIDKYSLCSSLSSEDYTISANPNNLELAKALKPFTMLEKEFNLDSKLESNLFAFQPQTLNIVQLEVEAPPMNEYENVTIAKVDENKNYENIVVHASDHQPSNYENVTIQTVSDPQPYENVIISTSSTDKPDSTVYENVDLKAPPRPLPRQAGAGTTIAVLEPKKRAAQAASVVAPPRQKSPKLAQIPPALPHEFNTIQSWLQEATEVIHECALAPPNAADPSQAKDDKRTGSTESLPRLIDFHPKLSSPYKSPQPSPISPTDDCQTDDSLEMQLENPTPTKKCIKINSTENSSQNHNYIESSSEEEDDDRDNEDEEEKVYELAHMEEQQERRSSCDSGAFDNYSDEDGEKLGPPEIVAGGPSEAYFNFHWSTTLLPPIGEVEEEFSSLENQQSGPIVIIDTAEETLFNDNNNNQHRESKIKSQDFPVQYREPEPSPSPSAVTPTSIVIKTVPESTLPYENVVVLPPLSRPSSDPPPVPVPSVRGQEMEESENLTDVESAVSDMIEPGEVTSADKSTSRDDATFELENNERIVSEKISTLEERGDQLMAGIEKDSENSIEMDRVETEQSEMREVTDSEPKKEWVNQEPELVADEDVDQLAVVNESVDSDFDELVKAQLDEDNAGQIQQIHERIIVGIESSSPQPTILDDAKIELEVDVQVQTQIGDDSEQSVNEQQKVMIDEDVPDCTPSPTEAEPSPGEELEVENNQGECHPNSYKQTCQFKFHFLSPGMFVPSIVYRFFIIGGSKSGYIHVTEIEAYMKTYLDDYFNQKQNQQGSILTPEVKKRPYVPIGQLAQQFNQMQLLNKEVHPEGKPFSEQRFTYPFQIEAQIPSQVQIPLSQPLRQSQNPFTPETNPWNSGVGSPFLVSPYPNPTFHEPRPRAPFSVNEPYPYQPLYSNPRQEDISGYGYARRLPHQQCSIIEKWPKFTGDTNLIPVTDFSKQIDILCRSYAISKSDLRMHAHLLFKDSAYIWFTTYEEKFRDWESLEVHLRRRYDNPNRDRLIKEEIRNRKQKPKELFSAFLTDIEVLAQLMAFGLRNAPACMQRCMSIVLGHDLEPWVYVYLDDIIILSNSFDEHVRLIRVVAERLTRAGLTINLEKSKFCKTHIRYLGYVLSEGGLSMDVSKIQPILDYPAPKSVKEVRRLLGLAGFYQKFIAMYSEIATPITNTLKKHKKKFEWDKDADEALVRLKTALVTAPVLANPNFAERFIIESDSSDLAIGAVLVQIQNGERRPLAYFSKKLSSTQLCITDNAQVFKSSLFLNLLNRYSVTHWNLAVYHPGPNPTERVNRVIVTAIRCTLNRKKDHRDWDESVHQIARAIRTHSHDSIGFSPYFVNFGRNMISNGAEYDQIQSRGRNESISPNQHGIEMEKLFAIVKENLSKAYKQYQQSYNTRSNAKHTFEIGDIVFKKNVNLSDKSKNYVGKFGTKFDKVRIRDILGTNTYVLEDLTGNRIGGAYHGSFLKKA
ncbi:uncharacterized protein LOC129743032 [Uranotaenia lowii]|uniref:uncharacterized protein LOC129743032 n=1 Tax=Uranotaenia lowii TaxID=190385 RepID=UPI00247AA891|nr:uncharacterized protein LOC129743032 [Uranotaenia lowii]